MKKFMVCSGFLGSGKTTTMMALQQHYSGSYGKAAMISNDLGAKGLVDYRFSASQGCASTEIAGGCICHITEDLVDRLRRLFNDEENDLVMSDIPGFGVGAMEQVYIKLEEAYPGEFDLAPFLVVTEPKVLRTLMGEKADTLLPDEMKVLLDAQLKEADIIALNKIDTIDGEEEQHLRGFLERTYPDRPVFSISALQGLGLDALIDYISSHGARLQKADFGYEQPAFDAAFGKLSEYNAQYYSKVCCDDFDANAYLQDLARAVAAQLQQHQRTTPHLKIFGQTEDGQVAMINLTGVNQPISADSRIDHPCIDLPVVINTTSACEPDLLTAIMQSSIQQVSDAYNLSVVMFYTECFGLRDEGRI